MPAIRNEEWFYSPSYTDGAEALKADKKDVRFSGLLLGEQSLGDNEMETVLNALKTSQTKSFCLDWFDVQSETFCKIAAMGGDDFVYELDAFHLTMIDLSDAKRLSAVTSIVENNKHIVDLVLTFCKINCSNVSLLADALKVNERILSLNINFNLLRRDGYMTLAEGLKENNTLRYLEAKLNKAEKIDLVDFTTSLSEGNTTIEYLDLGQEDDIDRRIAKNNIPDDEIVSKKAGKKSNDGSSGVEDNNPAPPENQLNNGNADGNQENLDLFTLVKNFLAANKQGRVTRETGLKVGQLQEIMQSETSTIRASLKHCKIMMLGEKNSGKTFFAHCLVHQLYHARDDGVSPAERKLDELSLARVTELGWTKITAFHHVDMIIAKRISTLPVNIANRSKANEVCFQFPEQVIISEKDLKTDSLLAKEDRELLKRLEIEEDISDNAQVKPVFSPDEEEAIVTRFSERMNDIIEKALRENNYPSFSIWDVDSPPGYDEFFARFYNNHGMIFVFFSLNEMKKNPIAVIESVLKYLKPIEYAKADEKDFTSKVFLIGTFLDTVINDGVDDKLSEWVEKFEHYKDEKGLSDSATKGHLDFLLQNLPEDERDSRKVLESVKFMLHAFNVELADAVSSRYGKKLVPNDGGDLLYFPLSNNLPQMCKQFRCDFDDISGINKFRSKVRWMLDEQKVKVINVMKSLRDAKIIDSLVERKGALRTSPEDHTPDFISLEEFEDLAATAGVTSRAEIAILLRYLDVTGIVSWLSDTQTLQNLIILRPEYIINGLRKFYEILTEGEAGQEALGKLKEEAHDQGLDRDFENLSQHRVVSHDLLLEKFLKRDNFEYFKDFLVTTNHLNRINIDVLTKLFAEQNLCNCIDTDELYLVPHFNQGDSNDAKIKSEFYSFKARFLLKGKLNTGCFERGLTALVDALGNDTMEEQLKETKNVLECSTHFAKFEFGEKVFTIAQLNNQVNEDDVSGVLQFEFNGKESATYLDFIERVLRNNLLIKDALVFSKSDWISFSAAKDQNLEPYFGQKEAPSFADNLLDLEDAFDEL